MQEDPQHSTPNAPTEGKVVPHGLKGLRLQPKPVDDDTDDPFASDLLNRKDAIVALSNVIEAVDGPAVLAVDGGWGTGKTTFLTMWAQYLQNRHVPVIEFNAWERDFVADPFVALSTEVMRSVDDLELIRSCSTMSRFKASAGNLSRSLAMAALRVGTSAVPFAGPGLSSELNRFEDQDDSSGFAIYEATVRAMLEFRSSLAEVARVATEQRDEKPLVIIIDELDRCRPDFAILMLERAKHLFNVDGIVFVLGLDREQLAHSVRSVYGEQFDAESYLRRFFDLDYNLPVPDRLSFIQASLTSVGMTPQWFAERTEEMNIYTYPSLLPELIDRDSFSLRDIQQVVHHLNVILLSIPEGRPLYLNQVSVLLILRAVSPECYRKVVSGKTTDEEAVQQFGAWRPKDISARGLSARELAESVIAASICVATAAKSIERKAEIAKVPLLSHYATIAEEELDDDVMSRERRSQAMQVAHTVDQLTSSGFRTQRSLDVPRFVEDQGWLRLATESIEMFSRSSP